MTEQLSDVGDAVLDHGWPLQAQAPRDHTHVLPKKKNKKGRQASAVRRNELTRQTHTTHMQEVASARTTRRLDLLLIQFYEWYGSS